MDAPQIPLLPVCLIGGSLAGLAYLVWAKARRNVILCLEAVMLGIALAGTLHLMYGAVFPEHLVEVLDKNDKHLHPPEIKVKLDTIHTLDILVGGVFLVFLACRGLLAIIRQQEGGHGQPQQPAGGGHGS
jgi:uncharacterized membrane protein